MSAWFGLALVLIVAALLRYPGLNSVPPGLSFDEAGNGVAALDVWNGTYRIWWPIGGGKEPLIAYAIQPFLRVFGFTPLALRACAATMGVIAALGTWWLARELFGSMSGPGHGKRYADRPPVFDWLLPTSAGLGLATAFWYVAYSRIAFRALTMPAVEALALAWLWRALRRSEGTREGGVAWGQFAGAGVLIGLGAYTYLAGRFVPLALGLFFVVQAGVARLKAERPLVTRHFKGLALAAGVAVAVFAPLLVFFIQHPSLFFERAGTVSIFNPAWNGGDLWGTLLLTTLKTLGTFADATGDPNRLANLPGRPMLGPVLAPLFWLGVGVSVWQVVRNVIEVRQKTRDGVFVLTSQTRIADRDPLLAAAYLFLLCWWPVMLLPGILAPEDPPHHLRIIGTAPATYTLAAVGLTFIVSNIKQRVSNIRHATVRRLMSQRSQRWVNFVALIIFVPIGLVTARDYYMRWAKLPNLYMTYDVYAVELARHMALETDPGLVYVIPMDLRAGAEARHYTLDFLYRGDTPYRYLPVDETKVAAQLTEAVAGYRTLRVVRWLQDKHVAADEREVVTFLLHGAAEWVNTETYPAYQIETWALPSTHTVFRLPKIEGQVGAIFGTVLRLDAAHVSVQGETVCLALRWAPLAAMDVDYKASLRLVAADGSVVAQKDRTLRHNWHQGTSTWPAETVNEYYVLPPVPAGEYTLQVVVYDPDTLAPLMVDGRAEKSLGTVWVK
jgi:4-amino-4-deoxy-L-arabinose transferase-like glycosyltransferase